MQNAPVMCLLAALLLVALGHAAPLDAGDGDASPVARACPAGPKLAGASLKILRDLLAERERDHAPPKRRVLRQGGSRLRDRDGSVIRETVPVIVCDQRTGTDGQDACVSTSMGIYREKPSGAAWGAWRASVGAQEPIDCARLE